LSDLHPLDGMTVFNVPRSHWHCYLGNFDWDGIKPPSLKAQLEQLLTVLRAPDTIEKPVHWFLQGEFGRGKTHLGVAAYRSVADQHGTILCTWINVPDFCERVKRSYGEDELDPWRPIEEAKRFVVLDDLLGKQYTNHEHTQVLYRLIDTIYRNNATLIVTMNQDVKELTNVFPMHEVSRLLDRHAVFPITSTKGDRRLKP
jgi:DNA replication protein DnaC